MLSGDLKRGRRQRKQMKTNVILIDSIVWKTRWQRLSGLPRRSSCRERRNLVVPGGVAILWARPPHWRCRRTGNVAVPWRKVLQWVALLIGQNLIYQGRFLTGALVVTTAVLCRKTS